MSLISNALKLLIDTYTVDKEHPKYSDYSYRLEHSIRVANIGKIIAESEGLNIENVVVGCLLHDLSYSLDLKTNEDYKNHGRLAAKMVDKFLIKNDIDEDRRLLICGAIAIHVDDVSDFEFNRTVETEIVGEADNIDRFDTYRIIENLNYDKFMEMDTKEKKEYLEKRLSRINELKSIKFSTDTSYKMWLEKLDFQYEFFMKLLKQFENSLEIC